MATLPTNDLFVDLWQLAGQRCDVFDYQIARRRAHLAQIVMAGAVYRDAKRQYSGHLQFFQRYHCVLNPVSIRTPVMPVVKILGETVTQQHYMLSARSDVLELLSDMANSSPHPGGAFRLHCSDARLDLVGEFIVELL